MWWLAIGSVIDASSRISIRNSSGLVTKACCALPPATALRPASCHFASDFCTLGTRIQRQVAHGHSRIVRRGNLGVHGPYRGDRQQDNTNESFHSSLLVKKMEN